jgi:branched-chain amino acid transport system ATP-binding protein
VTDHLLEVSGLRAGYGRMEVVTGVDLRVCSGETVALLGRNGAGKTTTLLAVAGLRFGGGVGSVRLDGRELYGRSAPDVVDAGLVLVPEGRRIFRTMTVVENLRLGAFKRRRLGHTVIATDLAYVLDVFPRLQPFLRRFVAELSGGEQQMVAVGQALMAKPRILLLDEPSSGLAPTVVNAMYDVMERLRSEGMGILVVEQTVERALRATTRAYLMDDGHVVLQGSSDELAQDPRVAAVLRGTDRRPSVDLGAATVARTGR